MRIFITGGTGFIGRTLCQALLDAGHQLTVLSRKPQTVAAKCGASVTAMGSLDEWDPDLPFDAIINLAGEPIIGPRWTDARKRILWDSRVTLTEQLVTAVARSHHTPSVFISGSAVGVYGNRGNEELDESSQLQDGFGHDLCANWETAAGKAENLGIRVCILRTGLVIGKKGGFLSKMLPAFRFGLGGRMGDGKQWMSWVHLHDHVGMMVTLLNSPKLSGIFNATAPNPVTNGEFARCLAKLLHRPAMLPVPAWLLRFGAGEMAELMLGGQRVLPRRMQAENFKFAFESLEPALRDALEIG